jgi:hypothetical protein
MASADPPLLPGASWTEDATLSTSKGTKLKRWGSTQAACRILDDCDREVIYELVAMGMIRGWKLRPHRSNSHWRIDLLSVWEHKQRQLR